MINDFQKAMDFRHACKAFYESKTIYAAEILELDTSKQQVSVLVPFGYCINAQSEQLRLDFDDVVEFIK